MMWVMSKHILPLVLILATGIVSGGENDIWQVENLLADTPLHGANGMEFDADGRLIGGSMMSGTIFYLDTETGQVETIVPAPHGLADDLAIGPDGLVVWTATPMGIVFARGTDGKIRTIAKGLPMINSINFSADGRLYAAQVTETTGHLYELDPEGIDAPRIVVADLPGLNGFEITSDDQLYGPLMHTGEIVRIDLATGDWTVVADGFEQPVAVNLDSRGRLYVVDFLTGALTRVDPDTGAQQLIAQLDPPVDNLAISSDDMIYVSHQCYNGIEEVNPETGAVRRVAAGSIGMPGNATLVERDGREVLIVPGLFCHSEIDTVTGEVTLLPRRGDIIWSSWLDVKGDRMLLSSFVFGQLQWVDSTTGESLQTIEGFKNPYAISIRPNDDIIFVEYGTGRILRLSPPYDGEPEVVADGLDGPLGMAFGANDVVYVTEANGGRISRLRLSDGNATREILVEDLQQPEGIAVLPDGRIVVAEVGARRLLAIDIESGEREILAEQLPIGQPPFMGPPKTFLPTGVTVGGDGAIYVTSDINHTVLKISR